MQHLLFCKTGVFSCFKCITESQLPLCVWPGVVSSGFAATSSCLSRHEYTEVFQDSIAASRPHAPRSVIKL